jgi:hypothetical protein
MASIFQKALIPVADPATYQRVHSAITLHTSPAAAESFLRAVRRAKLRIREFELLLAAGILGPDAAAAYHSLVPSDQGQIREAYLAAIERIAPALRTQYRKVYAYY